MTRAFLTCVILCVVSTCAFAQETIRPRVAPAFGQVVSIQGEFVRKPNDYYSQNMVSEPYVLKVVAVNGMQLKEPIQIEYELDVSKEDRSGLEQLGRLRDFTAYETVCQWGVPRGWSDGMQQFDYSLRHRLHVKPARVGTDKANSK